MSYKIEFEPWPKTARANREVVVTEKLDGTNAAIYIAPLASFNHVGYDLDEAGTPARRELIADDAARVTAYVDEYVVVTQSRSRIITPEFDNHGFARWVKEHADTLVTDLGEGRHFGEWWGSGIQRGYGLTKGDKRFSLFNTHRFWDTHLTTPGVASVPVLETITGFYELPGIVEELRSSGSHAAPGFMKPEGVVAFHTAARVGLKVLLENDELPKGQH